MTEFDPFASIPGYEEMDEEVQAMWTNLKHLAVHVADIAVGINTMKNPERIAKLFPDYRVANMEFIRARDIRDDCWEAYAGDYKY